MTQTISAPNKRDLLFLFLGMALMIVALPGRASAQTSHIVSCSSGDMHLHTCSVGPNNGIRLVRQRSDSPCEQGRSYGVRGDQIWVDHGCRAEFEGAHGKRPESPGRNDRDRDDRGRGEAYQNGRGNNGPGGPTRAVVCGSNDMHRATCTIGPNRGVRVLRQMSESPCRLGRTFGVRGNQLWVDRGCRAQFEVLAR